MDKVTYTCADCGKPFHVPQGSRRKYCTRCANKRVLAGRRLKRMTR